MKISSSFLIALLICFRLNAVAQWYQVNSGTSVSLKDVFFPTSSVGYAVGDSGTVLKTIDTGNTWQSVHTDSSLSFQSVYFTSIDTGYAAGGSLYKTTDAGVNWTEILTDTLNQMIEVYFVNDTLGFAAGTKLYKTTNAGISWTAINLNNVFSSIYFPSPNIGYFIGGPGSSEPLYKTIDGGLTFIQITNGFQSIKEAVYFINDTIGYTIGWYSPLLAKTTDGGMIWNQDTMNWAAGWDVYFSDENTGYYIDNGGGNSIIKNTIDGGTTWITQLSLTAGSWWLFTEFFFINPLTAVVVGDYGTIYKTTNGGGVGINENKKKESEIKVYPNPSNENIRIEIAKGAVVKTIMLHDLNGKLIKTFQSTNTLLNITDIAQGKYLLLITTDKGTITEKIIIQ